MRKQGSPCAQNLDLFQLAGCFSMLLFPASGSPRGPAATQTGPQAHVPLENTHSKEKEEKKALPKTFN
jgi:hypothetical protein